MGRRCGVAHICEVNSDMIAADDRRTQNCGRPIGPRRYRRVGEGYRIREGKHDLVTIAWTDGAILDPHSIGRWKICIEIAGAYHDFSTARSQGR